MKASNAIDLQDMDVRSGARSKGIALIAVVLVAGAVFIVAALSLGSSGKSGDAVDAGVAVDAGIDHGRFKTKIKILRIELERAPCDRGRAKELAIVLNKAGDYRATIAFVDNFLQSCDFYGRLLWSASNAHQRLGEYAESAAVITRLIESRPRDSDFWWWRAEAYGKLGKTDLADADYRQSLATKANKFAARRYLPLMGKHTPCEVAWSVQYIQEQRPAHVAQWMRETQEDRYMAGQCDRKRGSGRASIARDPGSPVLATEASINGHAGRFLVQDNTAFTVLTEEFAQAAGVSMTNAVVPIYAGGTFMAGQRAIVERASVGQANAPKVVSVVVDTLPGDIDGIVGLSFLWRFRTEMTKDALVIQAR